MLALAKSNIVNIQVYFIPKEKTTMNIVHDSIFNRKIGVIVNPVNCVGVMGGGLALQFKQRYPEMFELYRSVCRNRAIKPGGLHIYLCEKESRYIVNFPTKDDWRNPSKLEYVEEGLKALANYPFSSSIANSIAVPALGCGLGGLKLKDVQPLIEKYLDPAFELVELVLYP